MRYLKQGQARADVDRRSADVGRRVTEILGAVKERGDAAVREYSRALDKPTTLPLSFGARRRRP